MKVRGITTFACFVVAGLVTGCSSTPTVPYRTPQVVIKGASAAQARLPIVQACSQGGGSIEAANDHQIVCAIPMDGSFSSLMYRALTTPSNATNPVMRARYTLVESSDSVFITLDMFSQYQTAFGQNNTTPIQSGEAAAKAQGFLDRLKADLEGTSTGAGLDPPAATSVMPMQPPQSPQPPQPAVKEPKPQSSPASQPTSNWRNWGKN